MPYLDESISLNPRYPYALQSRGIARLNIGLVDEAVSDLERAASQEPDDPTIRLSLGRGHGLQGNRGEAIADYEAALRIAPDFLDAQINLGLCLLAERRLEDAHEQLAKAARDHPGHFMPHFCLGQLLVLEGRNEEAIASLEKAALLDRRQPTTWYYLAQALGLQARWRDAINCSWQAVQLNPRDGSMRGHLAYCLYNLGEFTKAREEFAASVDSDPGWPRGVGRIAWASAIQPKPWPGDKSLALYLSKLCCLATQESDPVLLDVLAAAFAQEGQFDQAMAFSRKAIDRIGDQKDLLAEYRARLKLYESGRKRPNNASGPK